MTISQKVVSVFGHNYIGQVFSFSEIKEKVIEKFPGMNPESLQPSDYCYNLVNTGQLRADGTHRRESLFEYDRTARNLYKNLGVNANCPNFIR